jgi:hypothetical protein
MAATFLLQFQQPATDEEPSANIGGQREEEDQHNVPRCETGTFTRAKAEAPDRDQLRSTIIPAA